MAEWIVEVSAEIEGEEKLWESRYKISRDDFPTVRKALDEGARRAEKEIGDKDITRLRATIFEGLQEHRLEAS